MDELFDVAGWRQAAVDSLASMGTAITALLPSLLATVALLGIGWLVSRLVEAAAGRGLGRVGLDEVSRRLKIDRALQRAGVTVPLSRIISRLLFWVVMLTFVLSAVDALGLTAVTSTIDRLIAYLPNVIAAGLIVVIGLLGGRFVGTVITSAAAAADVGQAARLGAAGQGLVVTVVGVVALEQLGVDTSILVTLISILLGTAMLSLGVAFALGAHPIIGHILAGHFLRQTLTEGESVEVLGRRGTVERVGPLDTVIRAGDHRWSVPNARLLEQEVVR